MADIWFDVDTAISEAPINICPLIDDTDFKSIEASVTYNATGLALLWNFMTTAGAFTQTAVTPTNTGGNYDWVAQGNGMYTIEIPASGGASINNDTEGFGWFTGVATGVLPWRGPVIGFRAAALNNALIDGGDLLDVNVEEWNATSVPSEHTSGYPIVTIKDGTGTGEIDTNGGRATADVTYIAGAAVNTSTAQLGVNIVNFGGAAGTFASGRPEVNASYIAGSAVSTTSAQIGVNLVNIAGAAVSTSTAQLGVNTVNAGGTAWGSGAITAASIATDAVDADALADDAANAIADAILGRNLEGGSSSGRLVKEALYPLRNRVAVSGGTMTVYGVDDATSKWTATVTTTEGANPITAIDPAGP